MSRSAAQHPRWGSVTRRLAAIAAVALLAVGAAAFGGDDDDAGGGGGEESASTTAAEECQATIGVMAPLTGEAATQGQEQANFAKLAVDNFNQEHGTRLQVEEGDTQLDPAQASTVAQQFVSDDSMLGVVGAAGTGGVEAIGPIFARADLGFVSQSATGTELTQGGQYPTFARVVPPDSAQGPTDAQYMVDVLDASRVVIVDDQTSYSTGLADAAGDTLEEAGVTVERESINQDQTDYSALVSSIADDTDIVFLPWQLAANAQLFGQQLQEQGRDVTIFGTDGLFSPDDFNLPGSYVSAFSPDIRAIEGNDEIAQQFTEQYGEFGTFGPPAYAAATVVADSILRACQEGDATREAVVEQIKATDLPDSILGQPIRFDENGDLEDAKFFIFEVNDEGEFVLAPEQ